MKMKITKIVEGILLLLLILSIMIGIVSKSTFARYTQKIGGKSVSEIAEPILDINYDDKIVINEKNVEKIYNFKISNFKENKVTGVDLKYNIEFIPKNDIIDIKLFKEGEEIHLNNKKTDFVELGCDAPKTDNYTVKIKFASNLIPNINEDLQMKIYSEQCVKE